MLKEIPGYEGKYSATEDGRIFSHVSGKYLKAGKAGNYLHVSLGQGNSQTVHRLILLAFVGPAPEGHISRHLDGNGHNNAKINLEWATQSENCMDKNAHGTMVLGENHHACVLSDAEVLKLRALRSEKWSYPRLSKHFGISIAQAHRIGTNQNRKVVSCG